MKMIWYGMSRRVERGDCSEMANLSANRMQRRTIMSAMITKNPQGNFRLKNYYIIFFQILFQIISHNHHILHSSTPSYLRFPQSHNIYSNLGQNRFKSIMQPTHPKKYTTEAHQTILSDLLHFLSTNTAKNVNHHQLTPLLNHLLQIQTSTQNWLHKYHKLYEQLITIFINGLCCQNKNHLHYKNINSSTSHWHNDDSNQYLYLDLLIDITCNLITQQCIADQYSKFELRKNSKTNGTKNDQSMGQSICHHICSEFLNHIVSHTSCYISYYAFYNIVNRSNKVIFKHIPCHRLLQINKKLKKHWKFHESKMLDNIKIPKQQVFTHERVEECGKNVEQFLKNKIRVLQKIEDISDISDINLSPKYSAQIENRRKQHQKTNLNSTKIPPLNLPSLSKTINSSSRSKFPSSQTKQTALGQLRKLANNLGESFITVELGCLLANKRTKQIQHFTTNEDYRRNCMDKLERIETERMSVSPLDIQEQRNLLTVNNNVKKNFKKNMETGGSLFFQDEQNFASSNSRDGNQKSEQYYRKISLINANLFVQKINYENSQKYERYDENCENQQKQQELKEPGRISRPKKTDLHLNLSPTNKSIDEKDRMKKKKKLNSQISNQENELMKMVSEFGEQIIDFMLCGAFPMDLKKNISKKDVQLIHERDTFVQKIQKIEKCLESVQKILYNNLVHVVSKQAQKIHLHLLMNRNISTGYCISMSQKPVQKTILLDSGIKIDYHISQNQRIHNAQVKAAERNSWEQIKKNSQPFLLHICRWLQSLLNSADLHHHLSISYLTSALCILNQLLISSQASSICQYYIAEYAMPILLQIKNIIISLSYPLASDKQAPLTSKTNRYEQVFYQCHPQLMQKLVEIVGGLLKNNNANTIGNKNLEKMISNMFFRNSHFMEVLKNYFQFLVQDYTHNSKQILNILRVYSKVVSVYKIWAMKKSPSNSTNTNLSYITFIYQHIQSYLRPNGVLTNLLSTKLNTYISPSHLEQQTYIGSDVYGLIHGILVFISQVYYCTLPTMMKATQQHILAQEIGSYYIKYALINYIKLYSLLTVTELVNVGIMENNHQSMHLTQNDHTEFNTDGGPSHKQIKQMLMTDFLKILTSISINRTPELAKKIKQYRVLEFFAREIQLEFSVQENADKYIRKAIKTRKLGDILEAKHQKQRKMMAQQQQQERDRQNDKKSKKQKNEKGNTFQIGNLNLSIGQNSKKLNNKKAMYQSNSNNNSKINYGKKKKKGQGKSKKNSINPNNDHHMQIFNTSQSESRRRARGNSGNSRNSLVNKSKNSKKRKGIKDYNEEYQKSRKSMSVSRCHQSSNRRSHVKTYADVPPLKTEAKKDASQSMILQEDKYDRSESFDNSCAKLMKKEIKVPGLNLNKPEFKMKEQMGEENSDNMGSSNMASGSADHMDYQKKYEPYQLYEQSSEKRQGCDDNQNGQFGQQVENQQSQSSQCEYIPQQTNSISNKNKIIIPSLKLPLKATNQEHTESKQTNGNKGYLDDLLDQIMIKKKDNGEKICSKIKTQQNYHQKGLHQSQLYSEQSEEQQDSQGEIQYQYEINQNHMPSLKLPSLENNDRNMGDDIQYEQKDDNEHDMNGKQDKNMIYWTERRIRKIYSSKTLHAQSVLLILSLVLYKGQLDPLYCDQMPIINGKLNVLYILHHHLNHPYNSSILPILKKQVSKIKPYLAGERLLKLLVVDLTSMDIFNTAQKERKKGWQKISAGAFGVVMAANIPYSSSEDEQPELSINNNRNHKKSKQNEKWHKNQPSESHKNCKFYGDIPRQVAIKQMNFPKSIYERCVLHDIFTEITCLEKFRLEDRVTRMYNYGVIDNTYIIIMKRYKCSLKDWRNHHIYDKNSREDSNQTYQLMKMYPPTLQNILAIFYQILKGLEMLHDNNITHYDIKADNIMLDFTYNEVKNNLKVEVVFGDFGVCKIYQANQNTNMNMGNRGDISEELDLKSRGTQCIKSPQMLTLSLKNKKEADNFDRRKKIGTTKASDIWSLGCLFYEIVTGEFLFNSNNWIHFFMQVTSSKQQLLKQQNYQRMANNVYLIDFLKFILIRDPQHRPSIHSIISRYHNLYQLLVNDPNGIPDRKKSIIINISSPYYHIQTKRKKSIDQLINDYLSFLTKKTSEDVNLPMVKIENKREESSPIKIMEDIYYLQTNQINQKMLHKMKVEGITHIIMESKDNSKNYQLNQIFKVMSICWKNKSNLGQNFIYLLCPKVSDVLREVLLLKGKLLFINIACNSQVEIQSIITNLLLFTLSYWFKCSPYETWCLINTQVLSFPAVNYIHRPLKNMSKGISILNQIEAQIQNIPKLQCICGSVTIIMKKFFLHQNRQADLSNKTSKNIMKLCKCKRGIHRNPPKQKEMVEKENEERCFSKNCPLYLDFIRRRFNIAWDNLTWALINQEQHLLTPLYTEDGGVFGEKKQIKTQVLLNSSHPLKNMIADDSQSSYWRILQCKVCEMWILAQSKHNEGKNGNKQIWVILNNLIKSCRQGIMIPNAQQDFQTKTPALNNYTLSKLHMTSQ